MILSTTSLARCFCPSRHRLCIRSFTTFHPISYPLYKLATKRNMATSGAPTKKHKVTIVGSGNWGTTLAKVVAENTKAYPDLFEEDVQMWVFEEKFEDPRTGKQRNLSELINEMNENPKYLGGVRLPKNVIANPSKEDSVKNSSILIFVLPHQFIKETTEDLKKYILPYARAISCAKGVDVQGSSVNLLSATIAKELNIYCGALSGANIATEIAQEKWSETTVAYHPPEIDSRQPTPKTSRQASPAPLAINPHTGKSVSKSEKTDKIELEPLPSDYPPLNHDTVRKLFHREYFHVQMVSDVAGVSLGGALKNIIALGAGFVDGLGWGDNAKAAIMRIGTLESVKFGKMFFGNSVRTSTFTEQSCGIADVITSSSGGRNWRCAKKWIEVGGKMSDIEETELKGQKLQGTGTAVDVHNVLHRKFTEEKGIDISPDAKKEDEKWEEWREIEWEKAHQRVKAEFPLFTAVYDILNDRAKATDIPRLVLHKGDAPRL